MANRFNSKTKGIISDVLGEVKDNQNLHTNSNSSVDWDERKTKSIRIKVKTELLIEYLKLTRGLKLYQLIDEMATSYATKEELEDFQLKLVKNTYTK